MIDSIVESIPNVIASLYENIYIINKANNEFYNIKYNGEEIRVSSKLPYEENVTKFVSEFKEDILADLDSDSFKKILITKDNKEKIVSLVTKDNYKLIFVIDNTVALDTSELKTIIIADDSPIITKFFTKIFRNDFNVVVAEDGDQVIKLLEGGTNNLVGLFLDLQMPNKNGYEVLDYMQEHNLFEKIPVSIISGEDSSDGIEKATAYSGVVDMLQKPFGADAARAIVDKTIRFSPNYK